MKDIMPVTSAIKKGKHINTIRRMAKSNKQGAKLNEKHTVFPNTSFNAIIHSSTSQTVFNQQISTTKFSPLTFTNIMVT
jgi:hypothetical protein